MSSKRNQRAAKLRSGEIVRIKSLVSYIPEGVFRVDGVAGDMLMLSAGEIRLGAHRTFIEILERGLPVPASWLTHEVDILRHSVQTCGCADCRRLLTEKQEQLRKEQPLLH